MSHQFPRRPKTEPPLHTSSPESYNRGYKSRDVATHTAANPPVPKLAYHTDSPEPSKRVTGFAVPACSTTSLESNKHEQVRKGYLTVFKKFTVTGVDLPELPQTENHGKILIVPQFTV